MLSMLLRLAPLPGGDPGLPEDLRPPVPAHGADAVRRGDPAGGPGRPPGAGGVGGRPRRDLSPVRPPGGGKAVFGVPGGVLRRVRPDLRAVLLPLPGLADAQPLLRHLPHLRLGLPDDVHAPAAGGRLDGGLRLRGRGAAVPAVGDRLAPSPGAVPGVRQRSPLLQCCGEHLCRYRRALGRRLRRRAEP